MSAATWSFLAKALLIAGLAALVATGVRSCQEHYRQQGRAEVQGAWDADRNEQRRMQEMARANRERDERAKEQTMARKGEENERGQVQREEITVRNDARLQRSADGLRNAIASVDASSAARRAASACSAAHAEADEAATARALLAACAGRYRELAKDAADLADQVTGLQDHILLLQPEAGQLQGETAP